MGADDTAAPDASGRSAPGHAAPGKPFFARLAQKLAHLSVLIPKGLYARALIIIIAPIMILQSILTFVFLDRHWQVVTRGLSTATAQDIAMVAASYELLKTKSPAELGRLSQIARTELNLTVQFVPDEPLPKRRSRPFFAILDQHLSNEIRNKIHKPYWIDTIGSSAFIEIRIKLDGVVVMRVLAPRAQLIPSNTHIFLVWMVVSATILLVVAILFLRNQIRPVLSLADAADRFGRGRPRRPISRSGARAKCGSPRRRSSTCATASSAMSSSGPSCWRA